MKRFFLLLALFFAAKCFSYDQYMFYPQGTFIVSSAGSNFRLTKANIWGVQGNQMIGYATVEELGEWTRGYAYKVGGRVLSTHSSSLLSSGSILDCLKTYEVRDEQDREIGSVEGVFFTGSAAQFLFYDDQHVLFAKATLNRAWDELTISSPEGEPLIVCEKTLNVRWYPFSISDYYWKVSKVDQASFDERFLWPFMGFISQVWWR